MAIISYYSPYLNNNLHFKTQGCKFFAGEIRGKWSLNESHSVVSDSLQLHGLYSPWNSPGQNTGVGNLSLLQEIFPTQGLNPGLPHCRQILYQLSHKGSPRILEGVAFPFSGESSRPGGGTCVLISFALPSGSFATSTTWEVLLRTLLNKIFISKSPCQGLWPKTIFHVNIYTMRAEILFLSF